MILRIIVVFHRDDSKVQRLSVLLRTPAAQALFLQGAALGLTAISLFLLHTAGLEPTVLLALLGQGVFAAALTAWRRLDVWWLPIQFIFPLGVGLVHALSLPPLLFLGLFLAFLILFWSTFRTRVPYYPSRLPTWEAVQHLLPKDKSIRFIDIGSGFGGLVLYLSKQRPESHFMGIEIAPLPWAVANLRARLAGRPRQFRLGDYNDLDFGEFDVVFAFLSPAAMPDLWQKAKREMRPGSLLLSYEFKIPGIPPEITTEADERKATICGWHL